MNRPAITWASAAVPFFFEVLVADDVAGLPLDGPRCRLPAPTCESPAFELFDGTSVEEGWLGVFSFLDGTNCFSAPFLSDMEAGEEVSTPDVVFSGGWLFAGELFGGSCLASGSGCLEHEQQVVAPMSKTLHNMTDDVCLTRYFERSIKSLCIGDWR